MNSLFAMIARLIGFYSTIIWIRIMLTWLPSQRYQGANQDGPFISVLKGICDPFLNIFRSSKTVAGRLDFSPLLALMTLNILQSMFTILSQSGTITIGLVIALLVQGLWRYFFSYILVLLCIALAVRYIFGRKPYDARSQAMLRVIDPLVTKPVNFTAKIFYSKKAVSDQQYVLTAFIFYLVLYIAIKRGLVYLIAVLSRVV